MNNKKIFAISLAMLLILSTLAGCRKINKDDVYSSNLNSEIVYGNVDIVESSEVESAIQPVVDSSSGNDGTITNNSGSDINTNSNDETNVNTGDNDGAQQGGAQQGGAQQGGAQQDGGQQDVAQQDEPKTTVNPYGVEILGSGTAADPYIDTPNLDTSILKTLTIPANSSVFYSVYRIVGRELTINNANTYVTYDGKKYSAVDGKVNFVVKEPNNYIPMSPVVLEIGNTSSAPLNLDVVFADVVGSWEQSASINITQKNTIHFDKGKEQSEIYYEYIAEKSGTLHFYFTETVDTTNSFEFYVQNNTGATVQKNNSDDLTTPTDDDIFEVEIAVNQGDHIKIYFANTKQGRNYLETNVEWYAVYK